MARALTLLITILCLTIAAALEASGAIECKRALLKGYFRVTQVRPEVAYTKYLMSNLQIASLSDPSLATGATVFYFPGGARASYDSRGGSVAAIETTLLDEGSYSNQIDAVVFAGGSTMGLAAHGGVRREIFRSRSEDAGAFDAIPGVPGAIVYDFGAREGKQDPLVYPTEKMGVALMKNLSADTFILGRAGAGTSSTANKVSEEIFGGQGAAFKDLGFAKIFVAVVPNPVGNIVFPGKTTSKGKKPEPGKNTTLSLVIVDADMDRNQLKRLAVTVHTSMARFIDPFHTYSDGDILFTVSNGRRILPKATDDFDPEYEITMAASELMGQAIIRGVRVANGMEQ